jgi:hypothetical protein
MAVVALGLIISHSAIALDRLRSNPVAANREGWKGSVK